MTEDQALALALVPSLSRVGLTARLLASDPELLELANARLASVGEVRRRAHDLGIAVVPWNAPAYPQLLLATTDCPPALWFRGRLDLLERPCVAIVGSRAATAVALEIATVIAADLAQSGIVVVSGLARGVDSAAHRGALRRGQTVAVLGSGLDQVYPPEHVSLVDDIARQGLALSEYPPGTPPLPYHFPQRNRVISGLSLGIVVIEAAEGSGSLITAACALEQGRGVMVVPGNVLTGRNRGGHALVRDGATIVECAEDILDELGLAHQGGSATRAERRHPQREPLLDVMEEGETYDLDALTVLLGMPGPRLLARLLELEIQGRVGRVGGGRFIRLGRPC